MGLKPFVAYEASAGSGKTFTLSVRYVSLLFYDIRPEKILALTFTKKAANEMKQRIAEVLAELEHKPAELEAICDATGMSKEAVLKQKPLIYARFLRSEHKIMTIDSFLHLIVKNFSLYAGLAPDFTIGKLHDFLMESGFLKRVRQEGCWEDLIWLALHENKKMKDIFTLFAFLYSKDLELPAPPKPEKEASFAIETSLLEDARVLQEMVEACPDASDKLKGMVVNESVDVLAKRSWIDRESLSYPRSLFNKCHTDAMDELLARMQTKLAQFYRAREAEILARLFKLYGIYKQTIEGIKKGSGTLDFQDLTNITAELLEGIDSDFLYFRLDGKIEHLLIDEFQDTSIAQYRILKPIIEEIRSGIGTSDSIKSFFYVGDVKQSIYRFRGGNASLFGFVRDHHAVELEYLDTNYRSSEAVVTFVNETFGDKIAGYHPQKVKTGAHGGYVEVAAAEDITEQMVETVRSMHEAGIPYGDMALLVFTNNDVVELKEALHAAFGPIPIVTDSSKKLTSQNDVKAVIELVKHLYFEAEIFAENFRALSGYSGAIDSKQYKKLLFVPFTQLLHRLVGDFGLFREDPNLLKFVEECRQFNDAEAFIYGYELMDTPMLKGSHEGLRILTIHKSKGLEFPHVIVMDRLGRSQNSSDTLIFNYDGIELKEIAYRFAAREKVDAHYGRLKEEENKMAERDLLNTLYVAFTRARESLVVIGKEKSSAFEELALAPMSRGRLDAGAVQTKGTPVSQQLEYTPQNYGRQEIALKKEKGVEEFDFHAVDTGLALHYALEMLYDFDPGSIDDAMTAVGNRFVLPAESMHKVREMVTRLIGEASFKNLIRGEIYKERSFILDGEMGVIDLYVIDGDTIRIIDYKTGQPRPGYAEQIGRYKTALASLYPGKTIQGYLCYVDTASIRIETVA